VQDLFVELVDLLFFLRPTDRLRSRRPAHVHFPGIHQPAKAERRQCQHAQQR